MGGGKLEQIHSLTMTRRPCARYSTLQPISGTRYVCYITKNTRLPFYKERNTHSRRYAYRIALSTLYNLENICLSVIIVSPSDTLQSRLAACAERVGDTTSGTLASHASSSGGHRVLSIADNSKAIPSHKASIAADFFF